MLSSFTQKACTHVNVSKQVWAKSSDMYMKDKAKAISVKQSEMEVRRSFVTSEVTQDKATIIKAIKSKIVREVKMRQKIESLRGSIQPQAMGEVLGVEAAKISDGLYVEFGFDTQHLDIAARHHQIAPNQPEILQFT